MANKKKNSKVQKNKHRELRIIDAILDTYAMELLVYNSENSGGIERVMEDIKLYVEITTDDHIVNKVDLNSKVKKHILKIVEEGV